MATWLPFPAAAINSRDPKSLVRDRACPEAFLEAVHTLQEGRGLGGLSSLLSQPEGMLFQGDEGEGAGIPEAGWVHPRPLFTLDLKEGKGLERLCPLANWDKTSTTPLKTAHK